MELKDAVLSTLAEIEENFSHSARREELRHLVSSDTMSAYEDFKDIDADEQSLERFLVNIRERVLVLFEGLLTIEQDNKNDMLLLEKKLDLIINFMEYLLSSIDEKLDKTQE